MRYRKLTDREFWQRGSGGMSMVAIALASLLLLISVLVLELMNLRLCEMDCQMAADTIADGIAVFMADEGGTYEEACEKMEELRNLMDSATGSVIYDAVLDEGELDNNRAKVTVYSRGQIRDGLSNTSVIPYQVAKTATTEFTRRSTIVDLTGVHTDIPYLVWAVDIANDDSHGYCLHSVYQGMGNPDYDCSSFVSYGLRAGGYNVPIFSTSSEVSTLRGFGFSVIPYSDAALQSGDILFRPTSSAHTGHTEFYVGNGWNVGAHQSEDASRDYLYGRPGDQTGQEICMTINSGAASGWTLIIRPPERII